MVEKARWEDETARGSRQAPPCGRRVPPLLGAHVSIAGGLERAPERARELGMDAIQIFTGQPQRWAERPLPEEEAAAFAAAREAAGVRFVASHDSYLINLASPVEEHFRRSAAAFSAELDRCVRLDLDVLVTHPGNATDGAREEAMRRNADTVGRALEAHPGRTRVLLETTAGSGTALGWRFEELARMIDAVPPGPRERLGVCLDTAHVLAAGYRLDEDPSGVVDELDRVVGLGRLGLLHLNDSKAPRGARVDRHAHIGEGALGEGPFAALLRDPRLLGVPCVIETPKEGDFRVTDRRNLDRLRALAGPAD